MRDVLIDDRTMLSRTFDGRGSREIGRKSEIVGLFFFGMGMTFASFQQSGNTHSAIDMAKMCVSGGARISDAALSKRAVRWS